MQHTDIPVMLGPNRGVVMAVDWGVWAPIIGSVGGAVVGAGLASVFGLWQARRIHSLEHRDRVRGLIRALEGELGVVGELVAVDLDLNNLSKSSQVNEKLGRIAASRTVFEGYAGKLGMLPGSLPTSVVRAYGRIAAKAEAMRALAGSSGFFTRLNNEPRDPERQAEYERHRNELSTEVDSLLAELRITLGKAGMKSGEH